MMTKPLRGSTPAPDHIMLAICGDARTTMAVTWRTDVTVTGGWMELRPEWGGEAEKTRVEAVSRSFVSDVDESVIHTARAVGLTPGTRYFYTVGDGANRSDEFWFDTEPESLTNYRFLIIADQQNDDPFPAPEYRPVRKMLDRALERFPDCRFLVSLGDNVSNGQNEIQWNGLFYGMKGICEHLPFMMITGNHDNRGYRVYEENHCEGKFYLEHADFFDTMFGDAYPDNGPEGYKGENYAFDYGDVHYTVMGINDFGPIGRWARDDMLASDKRWKLGLFHYPVFSIMPEGVSALFMDGLAECVDEAKPDVMFAGHEHSFARSYPIRDYQLYDRPSEGTVHYILGNSGENAYSSNADKVWYYNFYPQEERNCMYAVVDVTPDRLTVTAYLNDDRAVDTFTIDKTADVIWPPLASPVYRYTRMAFKGALTELAACDTNACMTDGAWFAPFAVCAQSVGAEVVKEPGRVTIAMYGVRAVFAENSDSAVVNGEAVRLSRTVFRGSKGELYLPVDDVARIFGLKYVYMARNNILDFDFGEETYPRSVQPAADETDPQQSLRAAFGGIRAPGVNPPKP